MRVAVIGLGTMGAPMARHLLAGGHEVTVHNRTRDKELQLAEAGAARAASPADAARNAEAVLTCVSDTPDLEAVLLGADGGATTLPAGRRGGGLLDGVAVGDRRAMAAKLAERGIGLVDAPVSGGSEGAERGTLTIFVGGRDEDVAKALPVLEAFGSRITHLGPPGAGQMAKAVNQVMIAGTYATRRRGHRAGRGGGPAARPRWSRHSRRAPPRAGC